MSYLVGPDISFYQEDPSTVQKIDFAKMRQAADYVIVRAGQNLWIDPAFHSNWEGAKAHGLYRGSYWFYDSRAEPAEQVRKWSEALGSDLGELPLFADLEESYGGPWSGWQHWREFLELLHMMFPTKEIAIYTAYYYFKDNGPNPITQPNELEWFGRFPLWIANYGTATPLTPAPWSEKLGTEKWLFWQYTDEGSGEQYGVESSSIDLNRFHGDQGEFLSRFNLAPLPPPTPPQDVFSRPYTGVDHWTIRRFGSDCHVLLVDPRHVRYHVTPYTGLKTVSAMAVAKGAQIVVNGDGWGINGRYPNSIAASDGRLYQSVQLDFRPWIDISKENFVSFDWQNPFQGLYNAVSGDRFLIENGKYNTAIHAVNKDPRTAIGIKDDGRIIIITVDGRTPKSAGVSFFELAQIFFEFGCLTAINLDGGGSTALWIKDKIVNVPIDLGVPGKERAVANHLCLFLTGATPDPGPDPEPPPNGGTMTDYIVRVPVRPRPEPSMFSPSNEPNLPIGYTFSSDTTQDVTEVIEGVTHNLTFVQLPDSFWVVKEYKGVVYVEATGETPPPPSTQYTPFTLTLAGHKPFSGNAEKL